MKTWGCILLKKRILAFFCIPLLLTGCSLNNSSKKEAPVNDKYNVSAMKTALINAAKTLPKSSFLYFEDGLEISGLGATYDGRETNFDDYYFFPAIESLTGTHLSIDWKDEEQYSKSVAATLLSSKNNLPDIISPINFGIMDLADDGLIIPLDDYLDLMPDIVKAVGEDHLNEWRATDGHIYTIPSVSTVKGSYSMMIRKDWLIELGMSEPTTYKEWLTYWRAVKKTDLNHNGDPNDEIPLALAGGIEGERSLTALLNAFGIVASNDTQFCLLDDGTYTLIYNHPKYPEFLAAMRNLYAEGILREDYESDNYSSIEEMMADNTLGSTMTFAVSGASTSILREKGDSDALWECVQPIIGPHGDQMIPERALVSDIWCITVGAKDKNKIEDIIKFFNWYYTEEGINLYNYGIEGTSYERDKNGNIILDKNLLANGFKDYRAVGINYEPFGGYWLEDSYMQCLFSGNTFESLTDVQTEIYNGLFTINNDFYYSQPKTIETKSYVKYRASLITSGICKYRDQTIRCEITTDEFWKNYNELKKQGLDEIASSSNISYTRMMNGG